MSYKLEGKLHKISPKILVLLLMLSLVVGTAVGCGNGDGLNVTDRVTGIVIPSADVEPSGDNTTIGSTNDSHTADNKTSEDKSDSSYSSSETTSTDIDISTDDTETTTIETSTIEPSTTLPDTTTPPDTTTRPTATPPNTTTRPTTTPPNTTTKPTTTKPPIVTTEPTTVAPPKVDYNVKIYEPVASGKAVSDMNGYVIDYSNMQDGYVMIKATTSATAVVQVYLDSKSGTLVGQYFIDAKNTYLAFPLTKGANTYCVRVLEKKSTGGYVQKNAITEYAAISPETKAYITPNMYVDYNIKSTAVRLSCELCAGKTTDAAKVQAIYDYIVKNIDYDTEFAKKVAENGMAGYMDAERCLKNKKGICGDYSVLFATMCRAQGIPCMVVEGYVTSGGQIFHAWNKVYLNGAWKFYDTTFDAGGGKGKNYIEVYFY